MGSTLGLVGLKLSLSSTPRPEGTFGTPGRPGYGKRVGSVSYLRKTYPVGVGCAIPAQASQLHTHRPLWLQV